MNFFWSNPYTTLFIFTLIFGILLSVSSSNWIPIWIGLEINLYSFIPLLLQSPLNQEKEAAIKYFLVQALASIIFLLGALTLSHQDFSSLIIILALFIKLGIAPSHFWIPVVISSISLIICWILSTIQNIAPILLLSQTLYTHSPSLVSLLVITNASIGAIGGLNQTQIRAILAYSSISHIGWIASTILVSPLLSIFYLFSYILIVSSLIQPILSSSTLSINYTPNSLNSYNFTNISTITTLFSLGGLPPLFGFFPNIATLFFLLQFQYTILSILIVIFSTINLFYYTNIASSIFLASPQYFSPLTSLININFLSTTTFITAISIAALLFVIFI